MGVVAGEQGYLVYCVKDGGGKVAGDRIVGAARATQVGIDDGFVFGYGNGRLVDIVNDAVRMMQPLVGGHGLLMGTYDEVYEAYEASKAYAHKQEYGLFQLAHVQGY